MHSYHLSHPAHLSLPARQSGIIIIFILVVMSALSVIVLGSTDVERMQFLIVRNDQFRVAAYRVAMSEINAQLNAINSNAEEDEDPLILSLLYRKLNTAWQLPEKKLQGPEKGQGAYAQSVGVSTLCDPDHCPSPAGYSLTRATRVLRARIDSKAALHQSGSRSSQSQSFWYLLPQSGIVTFE